jgi:hypothetical protein
MPHNQYYEMRTVASTSTRMPRRLQLTFPAKLTFLILDLSSSRSSAGRRLPRGRPPTRPPCAVRLARVMPWNLWTRTQEPFGRLAI